jgi:ADP-dependent NAD(P)H-hydrate dehydratase
MSAGDVRILTPAVLRDWPLPAPNGDKSTRGTVLVVGGARTTPGAVLLAGEAALRAGAGKLQIATAESVAVPLAVRVPESMVLGLSETSTGAVAARPDDGLDGLVAGADVVLFGPGLVDEEQIAALLDIVLAAADSETGLVVDALALRVLADDPHLLRGRSPVPVLTPNLAEGATLMGRELTDDLDAEAAELADRLGCVVSMFGHVAEPGGRGWCDETAGSGLGTSGSGDVAAGVAAGLLARGADPAQAASWATHVHASAGQRLSVERGRTSYLAREILDGLAPALGALET